MAGEQAGLNRCECNAVFRSLHFFLTVSEEPPRRQLYSWNGRVFCCPQAMRHLHLFCGSSVLSLVCASGQQSVVGLFHVVLYLNVLTLLVH